jgi:sigma-54 dependent transcriptional regulator, acetoin dehydrogenase operon transcriptional activator AcoR
MFGARRGCGCQMFKETVIYPKDSSGQFLPAWTDGGRHVVSKLDPNAERQVMMAWERFVTGEPLADEHVSKLLLSSWQRSARAGVAPTTRLAPLAARGDGLEHLRRSNHDLLWAAKSLFMNSAHLLERSGSIMMLTDPSGVVLETAGDRRTLDAAEDVHLIAGGNWHEDVVGTNGIGTALAMRRPVQVHAAEHFGEGIKSWTCTAAPVFLPGTEQMLGVVDISGPPSTYQGNNLVLAVSMARQIEAVLTERASREHIYLLEASLKFSGSSDAAVLMVLDRNAKLIHTRGSLPGLALHLGACLPGLEPGCPVEEWARRLPEGLRPDWLHPVIVDNRTIGALLVVPKRWRALMPGLPPSAAGFSLASGSEIDPSRSSFSSLRGNSPALRAAIDRAGQLSGRRVAVLIQGETGAGKELFARAIHGDEQRSGPFVIFNCGTTSKELIASELFGHVRGAYTGATNEGRAGRFELAHGGTLCLDEIGELPLDLQPVLLRVLEEGIICRLGDTKPHRVDVRLLTMTNRDLLREVEEGRFRRDLYHRINVTHVRVPPLREREPDIEPLIAHFNSSLAARHGVPSRDYSADVLALLRAYRWPGNVRELRNVVESLLLTSSEAEVRCHELPEELLSAVGRGVLVDAPTPATPAPASSIEEAERVAITLAVKNMHGNLTQAARALGVSRSTLYRKVERYHLENIVHLVDDMDGARDSTH